MSSPHLSPSPLFTTYLGIISLLSLQKPWRLGANISTMPLRPLASGGRLCLSSTYFSDPYWGLSWVCLKHFLTIFTMGLWLKMVLTLSYYIYITKYPFYKALWLLLVGSLFCNKNLTLYPFLKRIQKHLFPILPSHSELTNLWNAMK